MTSKFRGQSHDINSLVILKENVLLSAGLTTDICIYNLYKGRFFEKYKKKVNTSKELLTSDIKRHISAFEHKSKIYTSKPADKSILILHRNNSHIDLWSINEEYSEQVTHLAKLQKKVIIFIN
jgi:hypothetical protein